MTVQWLQSQAGKRQHGNMLREYLESGETLAVAGVYDGISALLAKQAGFDVAYLSGAALSASMALPDLGLLTLEDFWRAARTVVRASDMPLIVDCDTGFGEALNVMRTVREMESIGVACIQIEDQQLPKKCGHLNDKLLISADDMCRKITAAKNAAETMLICARTDAAATSLDDALDRARRYVDAGADLIFVEALTAETAARVRREVPGPLLANMTEFGLTPQIPLSAWKDMGFAIVIYPVSALRVVVPQMQQFYGYLKQNGRVGEYLPRMQTRQQLYETIAYYDYEKLDQKIMGTVLAKDPDEVAIDEVSS